MHRAVTDHRAVPQSPVRSGGGGRARPPRARDRAGGALLSGVLAAAVFGAVFALLTLFSSVQAISIAVAGAAVIALCLWNPFLAAAILLAAMLFSPELELEGGLRARGEDLVIPLLFLGLAARACIQRFHTGLRWSPLDLPLLAIVAVNALASVRGALLGHFPPALSVAYNLKALELFLIYWLIYNYVREPPAVRRLVAVAIAVLAAVCVYAYVQIPQTEIHTAHRLTAPGEGDNPEPTTLGGYLVLCLAVVMAMAIHAPDRGRRVAFALLSAAVLVPILFTLSRTTYLACAAMIPLLAVSTRQWKLLLGYVFAMLLAPVLLPGSVVQRVMMTFDEARIHGLDPSFMERVEVWRKAGYTLQTSPLLGFGVPQLILDSQFVRIIMESGILGLGAWVAALATAYRMGRRVWRRAVDPLHKALAAGYSAGLVALVVHGFGAITFNIVRIAEPFWFFTGIVASLDAWYRDAPRRPAARAPSAAEPPPAAAPPFRD